MRMVVPDRGCIETDIGQRRYRGRIFDVETQAEATALKQAGYFEASLGGVTKARGYQCPKCGRYNFIKTCGRCASSASE